MSKTLKMIVNHWDGEFPQGPEINSIKLPFNLENFCIENDAKQLELLEVIKDLRGHLKKFVDKDLELCLVCDYPDEGGDHSFKCQAQHALSYSSGFEDEK